VTLADLRTRWEARAAEFGRLGALVDGAKLCAEVAADLAQLSESTDGDALTLAEAALASGYSADALRHMIAEGKLANVGRKGAPRLRRGDLPRKPAGARTGATYNADRDALQLVRANGTTGEGRR
jgi:hypothetical protein